MELIATARFKKAMDRASAATGYTKRITSVVADLASAGLEVSHPLLEQRDEVKNSALLVLTANRGFMWRLQRKCLAFGDQASRRADGNGRIDHGCQRQTRDLRIQISRYSF